MKTASPGPTRPTSPRPTPGPGPSGPKPPTPKPARADVLGDARRLTWTLIAVLDAHRDPAPDVPSGLDRQLGNMVAELRLMMAELQDLSYTARRDFDAVRTGGPFHHGLLPGHTDTARSVAAGGSAVGLGRSTGAGSKPPGHAPGKRPAPGLATAAAPGAVAEASDSAESEAGRQRPAGFLLPPKVHSWARPVAGHVWPGTHELARQVAANARRLHDK